MANSQTDSNQIDRLSNLPVALLVTILLFLPTHIAARTSVLCRCFRHLWEVSPSLAFISRNICNHSDENFVAMVKHALLRRDPSHPILSLHIDVWSCYQNAKPMVSSLLAKADLLNLRDLTLKGFFLPDILPILPIIFTINPLRCLQFDFCGSRDIEELNFPPGTNLTCLRSLFFRLRDTGLVGFNAFISKLSSLEDLYLDISGFPRLSLSSKTIRKLEMVVTDNTEGKLDIVELSLPELLELEIEDRFGNLSHIHANFPLLRKADIYLGGIHERNVSIVSRLLNCIAHVEELKLELNDNKDYPIPTLFELGKDVPIFSNLKHLDLNLCFHKQNFEAVARMLHNCSVLKSLDLYHKTPDFERGMERKDWQSKLPCNNDGNYSHACFRNLHLEEEQKKFMKLLSQTCN